MLPLNTFREQHLRAALWMLRLVYFRNLIPSPAPHFMAGYNCLLVNLSPRHAEMPLWWIRPQALYPQRWKKPLKRTLPPCSIQRRVTARRTTRGFTSVGQVFFSCLCLADVLTSLPLCVLRRWVSDFHYLSFVCVFDARQWPPASRLCSQAIGVTYLYRAHFMEAEQKALGHESAISYFDSALEFYSREETPEMWAMVNFCRGDIFVRRTQGSRADNQEIAIKCYLAALTVYSDHQFASRTMYGVVQIKLAEVFNERVTGKRDQNLIRVVDSSSTALEVFLDLSRYPRNWEYLRTLLGKENWPNALTLAEASAMNRESATLLTKHLISHAVSEKQKRAITELLGSAADSVEMAKRGEEDEDLLATTVPVLQGSAAEGLLPEFVPRLTRKGTRPGVAAAAMRAMMASVAVNTVATATIQSEYPDRQQLVLYGAGVRDAPRISEIGPAVKLNGHLKDDEADAAAFAATVMKEGPKRDALAVIAVANRSVLRARRCQNGLPPPNEDELADEDASVVAFLYTTSVAEYHATKSTSSPGENQLPDSEPSLTLNAAL